MTSSQSDSNKSTMFTQLGSAVMIILVLLPFIVLSIWMWMAIFSAIYYIYMEHFIKKSITPALLSDEQAYKEWYSKHRHWFGVSPFHRPIAISANVQDVRNYFLDLASNRAGRIVRFKDEWYNKLIWGLSTKVFAYCVGFGVLFSLITGEWSRHNGENKKIYLFSREDNIKLRKEYCDFISEPYRPYGTLEYALAGDDTDLLNRAFIEGYFYDNDINFDIWRTDQSERSMFWGSEHWGYHYTNSYNSTVANIFANIIIGFYFFALEDPTQGYGYQDDGSYSSYLPWYRYVFGWIDWWGAIPLIVMMSLTRSRKSQ